MRTIIHIGQHKTGTTSLQHYLQNNQKELLDQGVYIPNSLVGVCHPSHYLLNVYSLSKKRLSPMKEVLLKNEPSEFFNNLEVRLKADIARHYKLANKKKCTDIIWTNEGLYLLNSMDEYTKLINLFKKHSNNIVCVCCFREISSFRKSYAKQLIKQGIKFDHTNDSYKNIDSQSWLFDYKRKKKLLKSIFNHTIFIPYNPKDMISTFMQHLNYSYATKNTQQKRFNITK